MIDLVQAEYKAADNPEFAGNPFIEALPLEIHPAEYPERLLVVRNRSRGGRGGLETRPSSNVLLCSTSRSPKAYSRRWRILK